MKTLYLTRHAKSSWKKPELKDLDRPLNARGKADAPKMGKLLKKMEEIPELIISSPAKRAFKTASAIAKETGSPVKNIIKDIRLYMAGDDEFFDVISEVKKRFNKLMIVSHNFGLTIFANLVTGSDIINIPTAGIVKVEFDVNKWKEIRETKGKLIFFEYPKKRTDGI